MILLDNVVILEAFQVTEAITGKPQIYSYVEENRIGDHICYYSDLRKMQAHYPEWNLTIPLPAIFEEIIVGWHDRTT